MDTYIFNHYANPMFNAHMNIIRFSYQVTTVTVR